jgi:hypothetical protein
VTAQGDPDLATRVAEHYRAEVLAQRRREDLLVICGLTVFLSAAVWLIGGRVSLAYIAGALIGGSGTAIITWGMHAKRAGESIELRVHRERSHSRPCGNCGSAVLRFESVCPNCGTQQTGADRWAIDRWMPLMFMGALVFCLLAAAALSR